MDYYSILGVSKTATPDEIKKAYRKLASQHHPDKGGDKSKFQEIQSAYDVLGDPDKRRQYDSPQPRMNVNNMNMNGFNMNINGMDINDIFSQIFNNGGRSNFNMNQKQLLRTQLQVTLQGAYTGTQQTVRLNFGQGVSVININVPPGIKSGDQIKYDNIIENATLIVEFIVLPDLKFDRKSNDLYCNHSISVLDLITGSEFNFTTISGKILQVSVPPRTQPYMQIKLAGQGMPIANTPYYGDQLILLKPFIPDNIDEDIVNSILRNKAK